MMIVGLTGGIASGKSTIARALADEPGVAVEDADRVAWETYQPGTDVHRQLVDHFGRRILTPDRTIDRRALGRIVFHDEGEREALNRVVHPAVRKRLRARAEKHEADGVEVLIVQAALILEAEPVDRSFYDVYVLVWVDPDEQLRRLMRRDGLDRAKALQKIRAQTSQDVKAERANYVIDSTGNLDETIAQARSILRTLRS
ncbi:MAG: dephospho-CoA kinase [Candidatus Bipolaricaulia bacterium]